MSFDPGAQEIVIDEDVYYELHSGALRDRLQDPLLGEGTITLIIRDPNITIIGDMNLDWDDRVEAPLYGCKSLLRLDLKGCTNLTQLCNWVFAECSSLTSVALPLTRHKPPQFFNLFSYIIMNETPSREKNATTKLFIFFSELSTLLR